MKAEKQMTVADARDEMARCADVVMVCKAALDQGPSVADGPSYAVIGTLGVLLDMIEAVQLGLDRIELSQ